MFGYSFESRLLISFAVSPWTSDLTFLGFCFLISKMKQIIIIIAPTAEDSGKVR